MTARLFTRRFRTTLCGGLLLFALALRVALSPAAVGRLTDGLRRVGGSPALGSAVLYLELGVGLPSGSGAPLPSASPAVSEAAPPSAAPEPSEAVEAVEVFSPADTQPDAPDRDLHFTPSEAEAISMRGNCSYEFDKTALLLEPLPWTAARGKPLVLILHTHTSESYTPEPGDEYEPSGDFRTLDEAHNMLAVGDVLAAELEARGISVIHDRSYNDYPSYNASYGNAKVKIERQLADEPSIVLVLDLHRDALEQPVREATTIDGADCAKLMLVVGTDQGGLYHPFWQENLSCALKLQALLGRAQPTLCRQLNLRKERFNGQTSPGEMIVEVGSTGNTLAEAKRSMPYLADAVAELLRAQGG